MRKRIETNVSDFLRIWTPERKFYLSERGGSQLSYTDYRNNFSGKIPAGLKITVWEEIDTQEVDARLSYGRTFADTGWVIDSITIGEKIEVWSNNNEMSNERRLFEHGEKIEVRK